MLWFDRSSDADNEDDRASAHSLSGPQGNNDDNDNNNDDNDHKPNSSTGNNTDITINDNNNDNSNDDNDNINTHNNNNDDDNNSNHTNDTTPNCLSGPSRGQPGGHRPRLQLFGRAPPASWRSEPFLDAPVPEHGLDESMY